MLFYSMLNGKIKFIIKKILPIMLHRFLYDLFVLKKMPYTAH